MGRFTLMDLFDANTGLIVLVIVVAALLAFVGAELAEKHIGKMELARFGKWRYGAAASVMMAAFAVLFIAQPTNADKWERIAEEQQAGIDERAIYAHPGEIFDLMQDSKLIVYLIDVRNETDYNLFHILDSEHIPLAEIEDRAPILNLQPANTLFVVLSNDETQATEAWRTLVAESVPNVYVLEGGINGWLDTFADEEFIRTNRQSEHVDDTLAYTFSAALGVRYPAADPNHDVFHLEYEAKVELQVKRGPASGGCG
jgi:rhodanese-related sulfurtransferase